MVERLAGGDDVESPGTTEAPREPGSDRRESQFYDSIEEQRAALRDRERVHAEGRERAEPYERAALVEMGKPQPKPPQLQQAPSAPRQQLAEGMQGWLTTAAILGALAGFSGRTASTNALTAFGSALDGFKEGDKAKFDANYKTWKAQSDAVVQHNEQLISQYKMVLESNKLTSDQKLQQLKLIATVNQDKANEAALRVQGLSEISKNIAQYEYHTAQMAERTRNIERMIEEGKDSGARSAGGA
jgi:hypothetical protein